MNTTLELSVNFDTTEAFHRILVADYIWDYYCMDFVHRTM